MSGFDEILISLIRPKAPALIHCIADDPHGENWKYEYLIADSFSNYSWKTKPPILQENEHFFICFSGPVILKKKGYNPLKSNTKNSIKVITLIKNEDEHHFFARQKCFQKPFDELRKKGFNIIGDFWFGPFQFALEKQTIQNEDLEYWLTKNPWKNLPPGFNYFKEFENNIFRNLEKILISKVIPLILVFALLSGTYNWYIDSLQNHKNIVHQREKQSILLKQRTDEGALKQLDKLRDLGFFLKTNSSQILDRIASNKPENLFWTEYHFQKELRSNPIIMIKGKTRNPNSVFSWAKDVNTEPWVENARIDGMNRNEKTQEIDFEIKIKTRDF